MKCVNSLPIAIILLFSFSTRMLAQQPSVEMENVVITANQIAQDQKESGRNIISIKGSYFNSLPVHSVDELLRYLPGVEIQQRGPQGSQSDIVIRGGTFQQVLIIIDGVKLNDPLTGHFSTYIPIHPSEIERIEILKGAASAIWGSEAVGGVVNIITKTFAGNTQNNETKGMVTAGEYKLLNGNAYFRRIKNKTALSGGFITNNTNGQRLRGTNGYFNLTTLNVSFSKKLENNWSIHFRTAGDFRKFNAQNFYTSFASDTSNEKVNTWWSHLNFQKITKKGDLNVDIAFKKLRDQYWFRPISIPNDNKTNQLSIQSYYTQKITAKTGFTSGFQFFRKEILSNDRGNHSILHGAAYTILRQQLGSAIFLNESIRLDWDENYGAVLVPQINFAWTPSKITIRASAGKSIRDADFTERYNNYNKELVTSGRIGNPALLAEKSWNVEAGVDYNLSAFLSIRSTFFYRHHTNLIDWMNTAYADMPRNTNLVPTGSYALANNIASITTKGFEIDFIYSKKISTQSNLFFTTGLTLIQSKNEDSIPSFYISSHARNLFNFSSVFTVNSFSFSITGIYKKRDAQQAAAINKSLSATYFVCNSKLNYHGKKAGYDLFFQIDNVFDKKYSDLLGADMPGRWLSGGIGIAL